MKRFVFLSTSLLHLFILSSFICSSQSLKLVPEVSKVTFEIKSWGFTVDGKFDGLKVEGEWHEDNLGGSWFKASVEAKTVDANIDARNESLRGEDYFYVEKFPQISIRSTSMSKTSTGYEMKAVLKMRDVEKNVTIPFTVSKQGNNLIFDGKFVVARLEYKVGPSTFSLGDDAKVKIHCVTSLH